MRRPRRTAARVALPLLAVVLVLAAGAVALERRSRVEHEARRVELLRHDLGMGPEEDARAAAARAASMLETLRAGTPRPAPVGSAADAAATRALAEHVEAAASAAGLEIVRLAEQPGSSLVTASVTGTAVATVGWLGDIGSLGGGRRAYVRDVSLVARPGDVVHTELLAGVTNDTVRPRATEGRAGELALGDELRARLASAFAWPSARDARERPGPRAATSDRPQARLPRSAGTPVYLGSIADDGSTRFAIRLEPHGTVAVVRPGDTTFGWTLVGFDGNRLVFEKEGVRYEVDR